MRPVARSHLQTLAGGTAATRTRREREARGAWGGIDMREARRREPQRLSELLGRGAVQMINSWLEQKRVVADEDEEEEGG